jgi:hypothetical protein
MRSFEGWVLLSYGLALTVSSSFTDKPQAIAFVRQSHSMVDKCAARTRDVIANSLGKLHRLFIE